MTSTDLRSDPAALRARMAEQGYLHVPSLGVSSTELRDAGRLLDGLFDRFAELPRDLAHDLGVGGTRQSPTVPEILDTSALEPRLRRTEVYRAAHRLARELLGPDAYLTYDHAIFKPPGPKGVTSWHQDSGYDQVLTHGLAIWVPFQDTEVVDGCMRYLPGSHHAGRLDHQVRTSPDGKEVHFLTVDDAAALDVPCRAGGATLHDFHMVHGAGSNQGTSVRRAWILDFSTAPLPRRLVRRAKHVGRGLTRR